MQVAKRSISMDEDLKKKLFEYEMHSRNKDSENILLHQKVQELTEKLKQSGLKVKLLENQLLSQSRALMTVQPQFKNATLLNNIDFNIQDNKEQELQNAKTELQRRKEEFAVLTTISSQQAHQIQQLKQQLTKQTDTSKNLNDKLGALQRKYDLQILQNQEALCNHIEVSHLRSDNEQLTAMLRTTAEYKQFAEFGADQSLRFLKWVHAMHMEQNYGSRGSTKRQIDKTLFWVPQEAFDLMLDVKKNHALDALSETQIELLLFELNKIWSKRQELVIKRIKQQCDTKIQDQDRRYRSQTQYDDLTRNNQISRLKEQNQSLSKENRELFANRPARSVSLKDSGMDVSQLLENRKILGAQPSQPANDLKKHFVDGSQWMYRQIERVLTQEGKQSLLKKINTIKN